MPSIHMADEGFERERRDMFNAQMSVSRGVAQGGQFAAAMTSEIKALQAKRQAAKDEVDATTYINGLRDITGQFMTANKDDRDYNTIQERYLKAVNEYHDDFKKVNNPTENAFKMVDNQALNYVGSQKLNLTNKAMKNDSLFQVSRVEAINQDLTQKATLENAEMDFAHYKTNQETLWKYKGKPADEVIALEDETFKRQYMTSSYAKIIEDTPVDAINKDMWHGNDLLTEKDKYALDVELQRKQNNLKKEQDAYVKEQANDVYSSLLHGEVVSPTTFDDIEKYNPKYAYGLKTMYENVTKNGQKSAVPQGLVSQDRQTIASINNVLDDERIPYQKKVEMVQELSTKIQLPTGVHNYMELMKTQNDVMKQLDTGEKSNLTNVFSVIEAKFGIGVGKEKEQDAELARIKKTPGEWWGNVWQNTEYDLKKSVQAANDVKIHLKNVALALKLQGKPVTLDILEAESEKYLTPYMKDMTRQQVLKKAVPFKPYPSVPASPQAKTITRNGKTYVQGKDGKYYLETK